MSAFYGMIKGNRGAATRGGTKNSGYRAAAQSWDGSVAVVLDYDSEGKLQVKLEIAKGSSPYGFTAFKGTLEELEAKLSSK